MPEFKRGAVTQKSCANPDCPYDNPQPIENFQEHNATSDGYYKLCRACNLARQNGGLERRKIEQDLGLEKLAALFYESPELVERILKTAKSQDRPPPYQIIHELKYLPPLPESKT